MKPVKIISALIAATLSCCSSGFHETQEQSPADVQTYVYKDGIRPSIDWRVKVNGAEQYVKVTQEPDFCLFGCADSVTVDVFCDFADIESVAVRPLYKHYPYKVDGNRITLRMTVHDRIVIEVNGNEKKPLMLFANPIETSAPSADADNVILFKAGNYYEEGTIKLKSGYTLYIEGGAIVRGVVTADNAKDISIRGCGILDARNSQGKAVELHSCSGITMENVTVLNRNNWTTLITESDGVRADNYKVIATFSDKADGSGNENDAFDLLGVKNAVISHGFSYCHDDAFCIKARKWDYAGEASDIRFSDCIAWNVASGNSFEIGYELGCDVSGIRFTDCCAIHSAGAPKEYRRGAIGIQNGAGGKVSDVVYENMYLEDPKEYGIYMTIIESSYNIGNGVKWTPGAIEGITFKNIHCAAAPYGCFIGGLDEGHCIKGVTFEDLYIGGEKITALNCNKHFKQINTEIQFK